MPFNSFEDIVIFAVEKEREAIAFYEELLDKEPYSGAKKLFESFANEEKKHVAMIESLKQRNEPEEELTKGKILDLKRSDYLVDATYHQGMPYNEILRLAMKREEKSLIFYNHLTEKTENSELKNSFALLAQEEAKHKLAVETLYDDYMAKSGD